MLAGRYALYIGAVGGKQWAMRMRNWVLGLLLLAGGVSRGWEVSSLRYNVDVWRGRGGQNELPENTVIALAQTRDGYLWLGTQDGLARFDGLQFNTFDKANTPGLNSVLIAHIFEDSASNLWVGTVLGGITLIKNGSAQSIPLGQGSREGRLMSVCEDLNGTVWLYTADAQLARRRNNSKEIDVWRDVPPGYRGKYRGVIAEKSGDVWVATAPGLWRVDTSSSLDSTNVPDGRETLPAAGGLDYALASARGGYWRLGGGLIEKWHTNHPDGLQMKYAWDHSFEVSAACEDGEGNLVVGTFGDGIWWYDTNGVAAHISDTNGLSHNTILSLCMDQEGSLWVGTDGRGLDRVRRSYFQVLEGSEGRTVQSVAEGPDKDLWVGFNGGGVVHWKDGSRMQYGNAPNAYVRSVFVDAQRQVLMGAFGPWYPWNAGLFRFADDGFSPFKMSGQVSAIFQDSKGTIWVGAQGGLGRIEQGVLKDYPITNGLSSLGIQAIAQVGEDIWVGTAAGLAVCHSNSFVQMHDPKAQASEDVCALYADRDGVLWIGTRGSGLERYENGRWTHYTTADGLLSDSIGYLIEDGATNLWMGTPGGFMRAGRQALNDFAKDPAKAIVCRVFGEADGLPTGECTFGSQPAACRTRDGMLWLPTINGLASIDPTRLPVNTNLPPVRIEAVSIGGQLQVSNSIRPQLPEVIVLPPGRERLDIQFTSPDLLAGDRVKFKYRMEEAGRDTSWTEVEGRARTVQFTRLQPGSYRFHVIACNEDGIWNEAGASLAIIVEPPIWRRWWFIASVTLCLGGLIVGSVHYYSTQRLQRQLALEKERRRIARDIHDQVGASLTQVSMLGEMVESDKDSPAEVEEHAKQISLTARDTARVLDEIVWAVNPSNDTLDGLITYFCKYAQEYLAVAELRYRLDVPSQLPATVLPPEVRHNVFLAAKEAITNIVRHARANTVWIRLHLHPDRFVLEIEDNGQGMAQMDAARAATRNGLSNMRKRLEESGGACEFSPGSEGGTLVRLTAPLR